LSAYYRGEAGTDGDFEDTLRRCAMQRLMQALGAYGFLGLVKGHKAFLEHIPVALKSMRSILAEIKGLEPLRSFLTELS
jgi:aminoglycoside/choline kinase family phosphotransferase